MRSSGIFLWVISLENNILLITKIHFKFIATYIRQQGNDMHDAFYKAYVATGYDEFSLLVNTKDCKHSILSNMPKTKGKTGTVNISTFLGGSCYGPLVQNNIPRNNSWPCIAFRKCSRGALGDCVHDSANPSLQEESLGYQPDYHLPMA